MLISSSLIADVSFKFIFIGDSDVGKSALIQRFKNDTFDTNSRPTVGVEFAKRIVKFRKSNQNIQIHLWDTAGQERYKSITKQHYRGADGAFVIFDLDKPNSFSSIVNWINEARDNSPLDCVLGVIGNKADLDNEITRALSEEALEFAKENKILYFETSARWSRSEGHVDDKYYAKGIENVVLDAIEYVGLRNPKKAIALVDKESIYENENITGGSFYEVTPSTFSANVLGDTVSNGICNTKGSSDSAMDVKKVNLNIKSENGVVDKKCACM